MRRTSVKGMVSSELKGELSFGLAEQGGRKRLIG